MTGTGIRFVDVGKRYGAGATATAALTGVELEVPAGSIFGVVGYSGAGKSTLIRLANALESPSSGSVFLGEQDLSTLSGAALRAAKKRTGMIFQGFNLLQTRTVLDNVAEPLALDGVPRAQRRAAALAALEFVGLAEKAESRPAELSGGQKQRVGIARAIVREPEVLLCDEATSALDPTTTKQIIELLRRINAERGVTVLLVTHEMDVIKDLCDRVAVMEDGRVVEHGSVLEVFLDPVSPTTREFVSTVLPDGLPERLPSRLDGGTIWQLRMLGEAVSEPLMSSLTRTYGLDVNILYASMSWLQNQVVGRMTVEVSGGEAERSAARAHLAGLGVRVEEN